MDKYSSAQHYQSSKSKDSKSPDSHHSRRSTSRSRLSDCDENSYQERKRHHRSSIESSRSPSYDKSNKHKPSSSSKQHLPSSAASNISKKSADDNLNYDLHLQDLRSAKTPANTSLSTSITTTISSSLGSFLMPPKTVCDLEVKPTPQLAPKKDTVSATNMFSPQNKTFDLSQHNRLLMEQYQKNNAILAQNINALYLLNSFNPKSTITPPTTLTSPLAVNNLNALIQSQAALTELRKTVVKQPEKVDLKRLVDNSSLKVPSKKKEVVTKVESKNIVNGSEAIKSAALKVKKDLGSKDLDIDHLLMLKKAIDNQLQDKLKTGDKKTAPAKKSKVSVYDLVAGSKHRLKNKDPRPRNKDHTQSVPSEKASKTEQEYLSQKSTSLKTALSNQAKISQLSQSKSIQKTPESSHLKSQRLTTPESGQIKSLHQKSSDSSQVKTQHKKTSDLLKTLHHPTGKPTTNGELSGHKKTEALLAASKSSASNVTKFVTKTSTSLYDSVPNPKTATSDKKTYRKFIKISTDNNSNPVTTPSATDTVTSPLNGPTKALERPNKLTLKDYHNRRKISYSSTSSSHSPLTSPNTPSSKTTPSATPTKTTSSKTPSATIQSVDTSKSSKPVKLGTASKPTETIEDEYIAFMQCINPSTEEKQAFGTAAQRHTLDSSKKQPSPAFSELVKNSKLLPRSLEVKTSKKITPLPQKHKIMTNKNTESPSIEPYKQDLNFITENIDKKQPNPINDTLKNDKSKLSHTNTKPDTISNETKSLYKSIGSTKEKTSDIKPHQMMLPDSNPNQMKNQKHKAPESSQLKLQKLKTPDSIQSKTLHQKPSESIQGKTPKAKTPESSHQKSQLKSLESGQIKSLHSKTPDSSQEKRLSQKTPESQHLKLQNLKTPDSSQTKTPYPKTPESSQAKSIHQKVAQSIQSKTLQKTPESSQIKSQKCKTSDSNQTKSLHQKTPDSIQLKSQKFKTNESSQIKTLKTPDSKSNQIKILKDKNSEVKSNDSDKVHSKKDGRESSDKPVEVHSFNSIKSNRPSAKVTLQKVPKLSVMPKVAIIEKKSSSSELEKIKEHLRLKKLKEDTIPSKSKSDKSITKPENTGKTELKITEKSRPYCSNEVNRQTKQSEVKILDEKVKPTIEILKPSEDSATKQLKASKDSLKESEIYKLKSPSEETKSTSVTHAKKKRKSESIKCDENIKRKKAVEKQDKKEASIKEDLSSFTLICVKSSKDEKCTADKNVPKDKKQNIRKSIEKSIASKEDIPSEMNNESSAPIVKIEELIIDSKCPAATKQEIYDKIDSNKTLPNCLNKNAEHAKSLPKIEITSPNKIETRNVSADSDSKEDEKLASPKVYTDAKVEQEEEVFDPELEPLVLGKRRSKATQKKKAFYAYLKRRERRHRKKSSDSTKPMDYETLDERTADDVFNKTPPDEEKGVKKQLNCAKTTAQAFNKRQEQHNSVPKHLVEENHGTSEKQSPAKEATKTETKKRARRSNESTPVKKLQKTDNHSDKTPTKQETDKNQVTSLKRKSPRRRDVKSNSSAIIKAKEVIKKVKKAKRNIKKQAKLESEKTKSEVDSETSEEITDDLLDVLPSPSGLLSEEALELIYYRVTPNEDGERNAQLEKAERTARMLVRGNRGKKFEPPVTADEFPEGCDITIERLDTLKMKVRVIKPSPKPSLSTEQPDAEIVEEEVSKESAKPTEEITSPGGGKKSGKSKKRKLNNRKEATLRKSKEPAERKKSKYFVYEDELLSTFSVFVPPPITTLPPSDVVLSDYEVETVGYENLVLDFEHKSQDTAKTLTEDDILSSLMTLEDVSITAQSLKEMELGQLRAIQQDVCATVEYLLQNVTERLNPIQTPSPSMDHAYFQCVTIASKPPDKIPNVQNTTFDSKINVQSNESENSQTNDTVNKHCEASFESSEISAKALFPTVSSLEDTPKTDETMRAEDIFYNLAVLSERATYVPKLPYVPPVEETNQPQQPFLNPIQSIASSLESLIEASSIKLAEIQAAKSEEDILGVCKTLLEGLCASVSMEVTSPIRAPRPLEKEVAEILSELSCCTNMFRETACVQGRCSTPTTTKQHDSLQTSDIIQSDLPTATKPSHPTNAQGDLFINTEEPGIDRSIPLNKDRTQDVMQQEQVESVNRDLQKEDELKQPDIITKSDVATADEAVDVRYNHPVRVMFDQLLFADTLIPLEVTSDVPEEDHEEGVTVNIHDVGDRIEISLVDADVFLPSHYYALVKTEEGGLKLFSCDNLSNRPKHTQQRRSCSSDKRSPLRSSDNVQSELLPSSLCSGLEVSRTECLNSFYCAKCSQYYNSMTMHKSHRCRVQVSEVSCTSNKQVSEVSCASNKRVSEVSCTSNKPVGEVSCTSNKPVGEVSCTSTKRVKYKCSLCRLKFLSRKALFKHKAIEHKTNKSLKCRVCGQAFLRKFYLQTHMKLHHLLKISSIDQTKLPAGS